MYETEKTRVQASRKSRSESREEQRRVSDPYGGTPLHLPEGLTQRIRESFGIEAERLKLRESPEVAQMGARATAQGDAIRFAPGEFRPDSAEGLSVLGHELEHVREQASGGAPTRGGGASVRIRAMRRAATVRARRSRPVRSAARPR